MLSDHINKESFEVNICVEWSGWQVVLCLCDEQSESFSFDVIIVSHFPSQSLLLMSVVRLFFQWLGYFIFKHVLCSDAEANKILIESPGRGNGDQHHADGQSTDKNDSLQARETNGEGSIFGLMQKPDTRYRDIETNDIDKQGYCQFNFLEGCFHHYSLKWQLNSKIVNVYWNFFYNNSK